MVPCSNGVVPGIKNWVVEVVGECAAGGREDDGPEGVGGVAKKVLEGFDVDGVGFKRFSEDVLELVDFVVDFERVLEELVSLGLAGPV